MDTQLIMARLATGDVSKDASITVYESDGITEVPAVYDRQGNNIGNPFTVDRRGQREVALPDGLYAFVTTTANGSETQLLQFYDVFDGNAQCMPLSNGSGTALQVTRTPVAASIVNNMVQCDWLDGELHEIDLTAAGILISVANIPNGGKMKLFIYNGETYPPDSRSFGKLADGLLSLSFGGYAEIDVIGTGDGQVIFNQGNYWPTPV